MKKILCFGIRAFIFLVVLMVGLPMLSGCVAIHHNIDYANVDTTFDDDYEQMEFVAKYLFSMSYESIVVRNQYSPILSIYGGKHKIENIQVKNTIKDLFEKGYLNISKSDNVITFKRWKKFREYEYRAGFAYAPNNVGELNIQFIISQRELSVNDWYFFEEDYNQWKLNN